MSLIKIALLQMTAYGNDQDANLAKGEAFCHRACEMGADIALFPEMWNIGYTFYDPAEQNARETWQAQAIDQHDDFVARFRALARELKMAIALTYLERWQGSPRNSVSLIDRYGEIVMTYAKVHTCDFDMEAACTPLIRIGQFGARAFENMVGVAMTNYATPQNNGHSVAFDAVAFDESGEAKETLIIEAGESEGVYLAEFDMDKIRAYREHEVWGNAFRRPHRYHRLTSLDVDKPFIRTSANGEPFDRAKR